MPNEDDEAGESDALSVCDGNPACREVNELFGVVGSSVVGGEGLWLSTAADIGGF